MDAAREPIPIGIIGIGKHGERYVRHVVRDVPELRIAALCRRDAVIGCAQAEAVGARWTDDFEELAAARDVEAVVSVAPPTLNVAIAEAVAAAGKALLIEKPLAIDVRSAAAIRAAVAQAGVPAMVAQTLRFDATVRAVREALPRLGAIHQIALTQRFEPSQLDWLDERSVAGGGNLLHTGVHGFDLLRWLSGEDPSTAFAEIGRVVTRETEDVFCAVFAFPGPVIGSVGGSRATGARTGAIEIAGEHGQIVADHVHGVADLLIGGRREPLAVGERIPTVRETLRAFARVVRGDPPPITLEDGSWAVAMAEASYRSAETGRRERVSIDPA